MHGKNSSLIMRPGIENNDLEVWMTQLDDYIIGMCWSADTLWYCAATASGDVVIINTEEESKKSFKQAHLFGITSMAHSPVDYLFATTGQDGKIKLWETHTGNILKEMDGGDRWTEHVQWSPDGNCFATASGKHLKIWDKTGSLIETFDSHASTITALSWNRNGKSIATASYGGVKIYCLLTKSLLEVLPWKNSIISLSWSPDSQFIVAGMQDSNLHFWQLPFLPDADLQMSGYAGKVKHLKWDSESKYLATESLQDIITWKFEGKPPVGQQPLVLKGHRAKITAMTFQNKKDLLVSGDSAGRLLFWLPYLQEKFVLEALLPAEISCLNWSPDDTQLAVGTRNGEIRIFDLSA